MKAIVGLLLALLAALSVSAAVASSIEPNQVRIIDGDTIRVYNKRPNVRLVGFNAPETKN
jgi:endonuclease YncB( thermonuclease family)